MKHLTILIVLLTTMSIASAQELTLDETVEYIESYFDGINEVPALGMQGVKGTFKIRYLNNGRFNYIIKTYFQDEDDDDRDGNYDEYEHKYTFNENFHISSTTFLFEEEDYFTIYNSNLDEGVVNIYCGNSSNAKRYFKAFKHVKLLYKDPFD